MRFTGFYLVFISVLLIAACTNNKNETKETKDKIALLTENIKADSTNPKNYFERATAYAQKSMFDLAYFDMEKAINIKPSDPEYLMLYSDLSFRMNKVKDARNALVKVRQMQPSNFDAAFKLAEIFLYTNNQEQSLLYLDTILQKDPKNTKALLMQGFNLKEKKDTAAAITAFRNAVAIDPQFYEAQIQLGLLMYLQNNKLCVDYYTNALKIKPNSEEAMYGLGLWYQDNQEFNKAIQFYTDISQINPKNKNAHFNLGYIHHEYLKVYDQAIKHYTDAINADPNYAEAYYNRGLCYEYVGNITAAKEDYTKALQLRQNNYPHAKEGLERVSR
ncbi:MAG TPA: tetratricopeptide repeat protein [Bacteroidia bacterium]|nr:tetratricopeptide repeat protein [Bacteroidia bacterium]HMU19420.1 tetratricopeptide repeat protein [Bacteroidia bacterium]